MNENVNGDEVGGLSDNVTGQIACVSFFQQPYARVLPKVEIHLPIAGIDCNYAGGSVLQETIREAAGRCAYIDADHAGNVDVPVFERALQFEAAATYVLEIFSEQPDRGLRGNLGASLVGFLIFNQYFTGEDQRLGPLTRGRQAAFYQKLIESEFQGHRAF